MNLLVVILAVVACLLVGREIGKWLFGKNEVLTSKKRDAQVLAIKLRAAGLKLLPALLEDFAVGDVNDLLEKKQALATGNHEAGTASEADQRKIESAIRRLQRILDSVVVAEIPADQYKVAFGATVMIRHGNGEEGAYQIVGVEEADPERGSISWISPLARALLSKRAGDRVRFRSPAVEVLS